MSRCLERTKTAVALPHCSESTEESIAGWCIFGSKVWLKLLQSDGMSYKKNTQVEMLPVVDLCKKSAKRHSFGRRWNTGESIINWFGQYTTIPRHHCLSNRMEKFPVHPIICKVLPYYALLRVVSIRWGVSISIQLILEVGTRSWHFSSNWLRGRPLKLN